MLTAVDMADIPTGGMATMGDTVTMGIMASAAATTATTAVATGMVASGAHSSWAA
jgi:hypothetical protein